MSPFCRTAPEDESSGLQFAWGMPAESPTPCDLLDRHRATGGCFTVQALAVHLGCSCRRAGALLDRWMSARRVLLMPEGPQALVPAFQIDADTRAPRPAIETVLSELTGVFSDIELTAWFVTPNLWLADRTPADLVFLDPRAIVGAARADRFIARG